ncbi:VRR-NUC domain-containing protein [Lactonifactor longoviformis]|uniref:VRR-NUC domain-containing protein n=1 Tax=Lactonifactor longoviformis TaxID=341220 RepID=UPI0036F1B8C6
MRENEVEKAFVDAVKKAGGKAVKFTSQTMNGVPDRLVLLPCGKCAFVELKAPGKQMRMLQRKRREQLLALGFPVFCVDRPEQIQPVMEALGEWEPGEPVPTGVGTEIPELKNMMLLEGGDAE